MTDWGNVPGWIGAAGGLLSAGIATVGLLYAKNAAQRLVDRERQRLANGVVGAIENGKVVIANHSDEVVTGLRAYFNQGTGSIECTLNNDFVVPGKDATGAVPPGAEHLGRDALHFEFRDARGDTWRRQWDLTERLA